MHLFSHLSVADFWYIRCLAVTIRPLPALKHPQEAAALLDRQKCLHQSLEIRPYQINRVTVSPRSNLM
jgi:hypothetical protein